MEGGARQWQRGKERHLSGYKDFSFFLQGVLTGPIMETQMLHCAALGGLSLYLLYIGDVFRSFFQV